MVEHAGSGAVNRLIGVLGRRYRRRRMAMFIHTLKPSRETRILDVGGTVAFWASTGVMSQIVVLNPSPSAAGAGPANISFREGDGTATGYGDQEFDIVFSNSAIEHVGTMLEQQKMAREIRRVGRAYWVQTPARSFPFDGHLIAPFVHWLPHRLYRCLAPITPYALVSRVPASQARATVDEVRFLSVCELRALFPDGLLWRERVLGVTKSFVTFRHQ